ncbi:small ribosomal subunit protein bS16m isoform X1 [Prorops nasuta]|uniref:small ribosomal subunit protein bS16m isoform X1 n=1 Tax=Prorops nasuta TaxID=863751 RepID=UPI0034CFD0AF
MPRRMPLHVASGSGIAGNYAKIICFFRSGCANRPFYHIILTGRKTDLHVMPPIEQLGSYDPIPNKFDEKLVSLNLERIHYWMGRGAALSEPLERLLGLSGFLPMHPTVFIRAWRNRRKQEQQIAQEEEAQKSTSTNNSA